MKPRLKITSMILGMSLLFLSSCENTPENIKENSKNENTTDQELKITVLSEIKEKQSDYADTLKKLECDNMTFSDNLDIDIPQQIKTGEYICADGFEEEYKELFAHYCEGFDESEIINDDTTYPTGATYENKEKGLILSIGCTGFFSYYKDFDEQKYYNESEFVKTLSYSEAMESSEKYKLVGSDEEISASEAIKFAQDFADDFTDFCDYSNDLSVSRISLYECSDGYFYMADYTQSVSGVNILEDAGVYDNAEENLIVPCAFAYICGNDVNAFVVNSCFEEHNIDGELTSVCDPVCAAEYISNTLASNMDLNVKRIALEYCMINTDNIEKSTGDEKTDREKAPWATYCSYDVYNAVAQAIMENPKILILDEPFNGLDKDGVKEMREYLLSYKEQGKTILICSHSAEDISVLCDTVHEMDKGVIGRIRV